MSIETAKKFIEDQLQYYEKYLVDIDIERREAKHRLELLQQKYEIYKEKQQDYESILITMNCAEYEF
ncbi:UNVERIFIED_CONTAM: hypothetical protein ABIC26_002675 [Paenibacillus sp. PvR008]